jgi:hypothetical protein
VCAFKDPRDHKKSNGKTKQEDHQGEAEDEPPLGEDRCLTKDISQGANSSKTGEAKEQRLKKLEEQVLRRQQ